MINTKIPEYTRWIAKLKKNPGKMSRYLMNEDRTCGCCLGWYCEANGLAGDSIYTSEGTIVAYSGEEGALPISEAIKLNISKKGLLTPFGVKTAWDFLRSIGVGVECEPRHLSTINDDTTSTHAQIAELIELLAQTEHATKRACFADYTAEQ